MPIIGRTGEVQFKREVSYLQGFTRSQVQAGANNRISDVSGLIATGDKIRVFGANGIPLDINNDGYADSPGGHALYYGAGFSLGPRTDHRTSSSALFYETDAGELSFYDTSSSVGLTTSYDCYIGVNDLGFAKIYSSFANAVNGTNPLTLYDETTPFSIEAIEQEFNVCGQVNSFSLNTNKQSIDIDAIGDVFGESVSGRVTGSGTIDCFFTFQPDVRRPAGFITKYLYELALRTTQGQDGSVKLYVNKSSTANSSVYYTTDILITQSALNVQPDAIVAGTIDFVATGEIALRIE